MHQMLCLEDVLRKYVLRSGYSASQIAQRSAVPKSTIVNWLQGRVKKPRDWQDLTAVASSLNVNEFEVTELLLSAGHPAIKDLLLAVNDENGRKLLKPWTDTLSRKNSNAPFQAIPSLPYFVGRQEEIKTLKGAILGSQSMVLSIQGMGGLGKTTLAAQLAYSVRHHFPDGVLWARVDTSDTMSILHSFANAFGHDVGQYTDLASRCAIFRQLLADKRTLIILDNVQTSEEVTPLLPPTTDSCVVLMTNRRNDLDVTFGRFRFQLGPFSKQESLQLFQHVLGEAYVEREQTVLAQISERLGHLPMAVANAANRLAYETGWEAKDFLAKLESGNSRLTVLTNEDKCVSKTITFSYDTLTPTEKQFLAALSVFDGEDFDLAAIITAVDMTPAKTRDCLRKLHSLSLVQTGRPTRYQLHPLIKEFVREHAGDQSETHKRVATYFIDYLTTNEDNEKALDIDYCNIVAAIKAAKCHHLDHYFVHGVNKFYGFLQARGHYELAANLLKQACDRGMHLIYPN